MHRTTIKVAPAVAPETSWKLLAPKDSPQYALQPGQSAVLPRPVIGYFAPPQYPPSLIHAGMPSVAVIAHLVFDTAGRVQKAEIVSNSYAGAGHTLFADAVRQATAHWAFTPLVFEETTGGSRVPVAVERVAKPFSLWFEFDFRVVDGKPLVTTSMHE
ncbi:MAG: energy transducer TonB [Rhodanobacteraceae bacterium]